MTFTGRVEPGPIAWIDIDDGPNTYADLDPSTAEPWVDEPTALAWAEGIAAERNAEANDTLLIESARSLDAATLALGVDEPTPATTVVYEVRRIVTAWGNAIEAEVLRGYSVVGQLALRIFDPWDGAVPFAEVDGRIIATVTGVGSPDSLYPWEYGIWVEGIALDHQTLTGEGPDSWLATRLIVDGAPIAGGSVPA